jgi:membrane fusion protein, multidrug efflux system
MQARLRMKLALTVIACSVLFGCQSSRGNAPKAGAGGRDPQNMTIPVAAVPVVQRDFPIYLRGLGTVAAYNTVAVKPRVDGQIDQINFREGQEVNKGDLLIVIDPRPFTVQLHQAEGTLARDQAQLNDAKVNLERFQALYNEKVIAKQQVDTQAALVGQFEGALQADRSQVENARLQLTYSRVTAPIPGRVGLRTVDIGNIVHASDPNGIVTITQMQPISVIFTIPEDYLPQVLQHARNGQLVAEAYSRDDTTKLVTGKLLTINNQIDPTTGTNRLKAVFDNANRELWPNQFVNVHLLLDVAKNATVIPTAGIQRGNQGTFAFVVKQDKTVEARPIKIGNTEGSQVLVSSGLQPGELVVTDGQDKLQPGSKVELRQANAAGAGVGGPRQQGAAQQGSDGAAQQGNYDRGQSGANDAGAAAQPAADPARGGFGPGGQDLRSGGGGRPGAVEGGGQGRRPRPTPQGVRPGTGTQMQQGRPAGRG